MHLQFPNKSSLLSLRAELWEEPTLPCEQHVPLQASPHNLIFRLSSPELWVQFFTIQGGLRLSRTARHNKDLKELVPGLRNGQDTASIRNLYPPTFAAVLTGLRRRKNENRLLFLPLQPKAGGCPSWVVLDGHTAEVAV